MEFKPLEYRVLQTEVVEAPTKNSPRAGATPIDIEEMPKGEFGASFVTTPDGDGYVFSGYIRNDGFSAITQVSKHLPEGPPVAAWKGDVPRLNLVTQQVDPGGVSSKADGIAAVVVGADVFLYPTTHTTNPGTRLMVRWCIKLAGQAKPIAAAAGTYVPGPEPCVLPDKLPYFRPNAPITRGQAVIMLMRLAIWTANIANRLQSLLVKYASGRITAEQLEQEPYVTLPQGGVRKFQDVSKDSPFFAAAQWGNENGIIGGYKCKD